jgi:hypothetical protein
MVAGLPPEVGVAVAVAGVARAVVITATGTMAAAARGSRCSIGLGGSYRSVSQPNS